jgi:predicted neutral ceramidase superfamily lipid hydrolase
LRSAWVDIVGNIVLYLLFIIVSVFFFTSTICRWRGEEVVEEKCKKPVLITMISIFVVSVVWWVFGQVLYFTKKDYCTDKCPATYHASMIILIVELYLLITFLIVSLIIVLASKKGEFGFRSVKNNDKLSQV